MKDSEEQNPKAETEIQSSNVCFSKPTFPKSKRKSSISLALLPNHENEYDLSFKVIVVGDAGVGKTCLINTAINNEFNDNYVATVGFEYYSLNLLLNNKTTKLKIWDTCGQEIYRSLFSNFYRGCSLGIIVFSFDNYDSFKNLEYWLSELRLNANKDVIVVLVGNKLDRQKVITIEEVLKFVEKNDINLFYECSVKNNYNVRDVFFESAKELYNWYETFKEEKKEIESTKSIGTNQNSTQNTIKLSQTPRESSRDNLRSCSC